MDINTILTFVAVATLLVISPGPNGFLIAKTVPVSGRKAGFANVWGFVAAFYVHGTLSIFGISLLLVQSSQAFIIFKMLGAAYLIWIGIKALISAFETPKVTIQVTSLPDNRPVKTLTAFAEGFLTNVLNPKVSMFYLAAFPQFMGIEESTLNAYALVTAHSLVNLIWFSTMVVLLAGMRGIANNQKFKKWLNATTGVIFIGFGSKLALMRSA
ncbi:LysE family translocator [Aliikangiella marina]|uniref:LysE family translocator n=1 Tax=Aliikangiella marina TaxID=1712262 RepID=A0A545T4A8_9GAMM|nr:LysE family translocator [Aliikangiella marina]TQV72011.1 LysE family translocator [Aliikangiella marina]TQV72064.1 LysE family translocator [Aliikangiella marina]